jgi:hypothetical protein
LARCTEAIRTHPHAAPVVRGEVRRRLCRTVSVRPVVRGRGRGDPTPCCDASATSPRVLGGAAVS